MAADELANGVYENGEIKCEELHRAKFTQHS